MVVYSWDVNYSKAARPQANRPVINKEQFRISYNSVCFLSRVSELLLFGSPRILDFFDKRRPTFLTDHFRHFFYQITACRRISYFTYIGLHNNKIIGVHGIEFILRVQRYRYNSVSFTDDCRQSHIR